MAPRRISGTRKFQSSGLQIVFRCLDAPRSRFGLPRETHIPLEVRHDLL
jgi:hypothetical protein